MTDLLDSMTGTNPPGGWRKINGCACTYCNTVWEDDEREEQRAWDEYRAAVSGKVCCQGGTTSLECEGCPTYKEASEAEGEAGDQNDAAFPTGSDPQGRTVGVREGPPSASDASERFYMICDELKDLHRFKSSEYGTAEDTLANFRKAEEYDVPAWIKALTDASDCLQRTISYRRNGRSYADGMDNALRDLASFAIIALILWEDSIYPPGKLISFETVEGRQHA